MPLDPMIKKFAESLFVGCEPIFLRQCMNHNNVAMYYKCKPKKEKETVQTIRGRNSSGNRL